jgi:hypothetical protein
MEVGRWIDANGADDKLILRSGKTGFQGVEAFSRVVTQRKA